MRDIWSAYIDGDACWYSMYGARSPWPSCYPSYAPLLSQPTDAKIVYIDDKYAVKYGSPVQFSFSRGQITIFMRMVTDTWVPYMKLKFRTLTPELKWTIWSWNESTVKHRRHIGTPSSPTKRRISGQRPRTSYFIELRSLPSPRYYSFLGRQPSRTMMFDKRGAKSSDQRTGRDRRGLEWGNDS